MCKPCKPRKPCSLYIRYSIVIRFTSGLQGLQNIKNKYLTKYKIVNYV